ncbi:hypothetical protein RSOL_455430 [Rhizoctonia solani AG-3 Rhs1AP]|uniref:LYC1 C-terminal domain-containing protein n=1 Tax=Rhizoctonia solani AG-3 Rhs1AP TaxID=1086054 RepID=X8JHS9_9AGAM|nr:hypothetical protein RSOL_455430 [Rhizoctonia solani AG-3 Rhs1AP]
MTQDNTELQKCNISQATQEQRSEILKNVAEYWGTPETGLEYFIHWHAILETKNYAIDGRLTYWVFVPKDAKDTLDILSCCWTYRRDASILHANSEKPTQGFGYVLGAVITPKQHRGRGYANRMLTLLHYALAPNVYSSPEVEIDIPPAVYPGAFSVLYSDIGTYYERCGPSPGEIGWKIQNPISTIWELSKTLPILISEVTLPADLQLLSQVEVITLLSFDVPDWESLPRAPDTTYVAFSPTALPNTHMVTRSTIHPSYNTSTDVFWGAHIIPKGHFITWAYDYHYTPRTLVITRIHADPTTLPVLLLAALQAGVTQGCQQAEVWNLPEELMDEANRLRGITQERDSQLSAIKWYGPEPAKNVVWIRNE